MVTPASGADLYLTLNAEPLSFAPQADNATANAQENGLNTIRLTADGPDDPRLFIAGEELEPIAYGVWKWKPKGFAGTYPLSLRWGKDKSAETDILVRPGAISQQRYASMLEDIKSISEDLLYDTHSPAGIEMQQKRFDPHASPALREYEWIRQIFPELAEVMSRMKRAPHSQLKVSVQETLIQQVKRFSAEVQPVPGPWVPMPAGLPRLLPQTWRVEEQAPSFDTHENRMVKRFLWHQLLPKVLRIREKALAELQGREKRLELIRIKGWEDTESVSIAELRKVEQQCAAYARECISWGSEPFLKDTQALFTRSAPSQVLQKNPHYQRFYRVYLKFQATLGYSLDHSRSMARIGARRLAEIYEMWSMFMIASASITLLKGKGFRVTGERKFFSMREDLFQMDVDRDASIELLKDGRRVIVHYEPTYPSYNALRAAEGIAARSSSQLTPDLTIELWQPGQTPRLLVFDAKYRFDNDSPQQAFLPEDMEKMWRYANMLRYKRPASDSLREVVEAAYMVYPGGILEHDPAQQPMVGALPLLPEMDAELKGKAIQALKEIIERIAG